MRLARLILHAFGPFSGTTLDFAARPAGLHLVYGPNEAGKSSALRAMVDLRFGVPERSTDTFVHAARELRVAGVFVTPDGETVGLVRRKGRKDTLALFDPAQGPDTPLGAAPPALEHALTAGLARADFELMFGIDHGSLRRGGENLLRGEGELGAALFEASAGTQGVTQLIDALDGAARELFNPHARAQKAVINEARAALEQARRELREAQVRPNDWHRLDRAHEEAAARLAACETALEAARRQENLLTELRAVAPQLRRADALAGEFAELHAVPDLPPDARDRRLAAEQALARARGDAEDAAAALARCRTARAGLDVEAAVIEHADAIERLVAAAEPARRARLAARERALQLDEASRMLVLQAARIAPGSEVDVLLAALPPAAERIALNHHLQAVAAQRVRRDGLAKQREDLAAQLAQARHETAALPAAAALAALERALDAARALGDADERLAVLARDIDGAAGQLARGLADLGVDAIDALAAAQPLLDAEIGDVRERLAAVRDASRALEEARGDLASDLAEQRRREQALAAGGAVVTAESLESARAHRDHGWALVRAAHVAAELDPDAARQQYDPSRPLADAFEAAQRKADHYADLLRADTDRVARLGEARARIEQMTAALEGNARAREERAEAAAALRAEWGAALAAAGLPALEPEALAEWQRYRARLLDTHAELARLRAAHAKLARQCAQAGTDLRAALAALGAAAAEDAALPVLVARGARMLREATEQGAAAGERERAAVRAAHERERVQQEVEAISTTLARHETALAAWHARLHLSGAVDVDAFRARIEELEALAREAAAIGELRRAAAADAARADEFERAAATLAGLLDEPAPADADDYADRLRRRLAGARECAQRARELTRDEDRASQDTCRATQEADQQQAELARLCAAGGVNAVEALATVEEEAARKRRLGDELVQLRRDIASASAQPEATLRERLQDLDGAALERALESCRADIARAEEAQRDARAADEQARHALDAVDDSDRAAAARETIEAQAARLRAALRPWARLRLGHALLGAALLRYRERAQGPMLAAASTYFSLITDGRYDRLVTDDTSGVPVLHALRADGVEIATDALSEGTRDQLYLALRLAALELRRAAHPDLPLVLDDVLITTDDERAAQVFRALARFAAGGQVMLFTHHAHLVDVARTALPADAFAVHRL
jgi:DNA repair protein SbcC/Rad50